MQGGDSGGKHGRGTDLQLGGGRGVLFMQNGICVAEGPGSPFMPVNVKEYVEGWWLLGSVGTQGLSLGGLGAMGSLRWAGAGPWRPRRASMECGGCGALLVWTRLRGGSEPLGAGDLLGNVGARCVCCRQLAALFSSPGSRDPLTHG